MNMWLVIGAGTLIVLFFLWNRLGRASAAKVKEHLDRAALVVDVRTPQEFRGGHFPGALNLPLDSLQNGLRKLGQKDRPIVVYCASGMRSRMARRILHSNGYINAINAGGLHAMMRHAQ